MRYLLLTLLFGTTLSSYNDEKFAVHKKKSERLHESAVIS